MFVKDAMREVQTGDVQPRADEALEHLGRSDAGPMVATILVLWRASSFRATPGIQGTVAWLRNHRPRVHRVRAAERASVSSSVMLRRTLTMYG